MIKFKVSAPGKIMLCGEHVMMYGKHVVAASLDLRTTLKFVELIDDPRNIIKIEFPDVNLSLNLSLELILNFFFTDNFLPLIEDDIELHKYVQYFITLNGLWSTYEQKYSLQIFLFLFLHIAHQEQLDIKSFHVRLATQLPINAGFGSSTSFAVCLAACFLHWSCLQKDTHNDFNDYELEKIMLYVTTCEKVVPNYVFGIDNNVCIYGQVLRAQYQNPLNCNIKLLQVPRIKILLIDSRIRRNKYEQMMRMAQMKRTNPDESDYFLRTTDKISKRTCMRLVAINNSQNNNNLQQLYDSYRLLGMSILSNQTILYRSGLSHPELDTICLIARNNGFVGKLTGFDGYAYIPLPPNTPRENIINLSIHLIMEGFTIRMTSISCNGVKLDEDEELVIQPFHVHLTTELKMEAGLGSSMSFATCIAACFLHWSGLQKGDHSEFTPEKLERISAYVMSFEKMISEFQQDYIVCTHGRVTAFQYRDLLNVQSEIINTPEMYIMLVDANICLDKTQQMQQ